MVKIRALFNISILIFMISFIACHQKEDRQKQFEKIPFLHQSKGTKNYEVVKINGNGPIHYDSIGKYIFIKTGDKDYKFSLDGKFSDSIDEKKVLIIEDRYSFVEDYYTTWLYDNDKTLKYFKKIIPYEQIKEIDSSIYMKKHIDFYKKIFNRYIWRSRL